jgi:uncharacterized membrane protein
MVYLTLTDLVGRFHPLVVHLPIGFLLIGVLFLLLSSNKRFAAIRPAVSLSFAAGAIASVFAVFTGYILSGLGDYDEDILSSHQLMGYTTAAISIIVWAIYSSSRFSFATTKIYPWLIGGIVVLTVSYTGHLGGELTHGEGYLSMNPQDEKQQNIRTRNFEEALLFRDLVHPILEDKCGSCHNTMKKKGRLSFASMDALLKGGKHGVVVKSGDPLNSEIIKRIQLPTTDKKFMPADNKPALTSSEAAILNWWIGIGVAKEDRKLAALKIPDAIKQDIAQLFKVTDTLNAAAASEEAVAKQFGMQKLPAISAVQIQQLAAKGFHARLIHYSPDLLDIRMDAVGDSGTILLRDRLKILAPFKQNIVWLDLKNMGLTDKDMPMLNDFQNIQRLNLAYNKVSDEGLTALSGMKHLESLNLTGTMVTDKSLAGIKFDKLKSVYVWRTAITKLDSTSLSAYAFKVVSASR